MASRGTIAKNNVVAKIKDAFGADYIGEVDKKWYVWVDDGGEKVQISIALTCPKTLVEASAPTVSNYSSSSPKEASAFDLYAEPTPAPSKITEEEQKNIVDMLMRLGL